MKARHDRPHLVFAADVSNPFVVGGDHHVVDVPGLRTSVVDMPHERLAGQQRQGLPGEPTRPVPTKDDSDMPFAQHDYAILGRGTGGGNRRFDLVLFDLDGVLVDTRRVMRTAWERVRQEHGVGVGFDGYMAHLGRPFADIMHLLSLEAATGVLEAAYEQASVEAAALARPLPGIRRSLRALHRLDCRLGVVTSKPRCRAAPLVNKLGVPFVSVRTPGQGRGKPTPDLLMLAMVEAGFDPAATVYVGDTAIDQQAARRAGVAYVHAGWGYGYPEEPGTLILDEPAALVQLGHPYGGKLR
jgi:HAD superfamily hydrolase (TIGR01509 family)